MAWELNFNLDYVALLVAALGYFVVGALTYSPLLFGRQWLRLSGLSPEDVTASRSWFPYLCALLCSLLNVFVLAEVLDYVQTTSLRGALGVTTLLWFGVYVAARVPEAVFGRQSWKLLLINACYPLLGTWVATTILTFWPGPS